MLKTLLGERKRLRFIRKERGEAFLRTWLAERIPLYSACVQQYPNANQAMCAILGLWIRYLD